MCNFGPVRIPWGPTGGPCPKKILSVCLRGLIEVLFCWIHREKEGDLTQSYDKTPYTNRKFENQRTTHKRHQNFDYTTIADRLRTVSWSNKSSNWCG